MVIAFLHSELRKFYLLSSRGYDNDYGCVAEGAAATSSEADPDSIIHSAC